MIKGRSIIDFNDILSSTAIIVAVSAGFLGAVLGAAVTAASMQRRLRRERQRNHDALGEAQADARVAASEAATALQNHNAQLDQAQQQLLARDVELRDQRQTISQLQVAHAEMAVRVEQERRVSEEKLQLLNESREQLTREFQNLANRIFEEKTASFSKSSKSLLDTTLNPLREQLGEFRRRVDQVYAHDSESRVKLLHEISSLKDINQRMSEEALNLTRALKGESKTQGSWGEVILERVLEESGLSKGREYETQLSFTSDDGRRRMPDVIVRLPEGKDVVIDAKVSLLDYERYCSATDDETRGQALGAHMRSLRHHIESLSIKDYEGLQGLRSLDFVLVFVPIESAFVAALEHDPAMFRNAYERNIIVVSPTTLLATLRTIQSIWRYERQNRHAESIARRAGKLHDQFVLVLEALTDLGRHLDRAREAYDATVGRFTEGRGNLVRQVEMLEQLGAKTRKRVPEAIRQAAELDEDDDERVARALKSDTNGDDANELSEDS